jgi:hypothetical protein
VGQELNRARITRENPRFWKTQKAPESGTHGGPGKNNLTDVLELTLTLLVHREEA